MRRPKHVVEFYEWMIFCGGSLAMTSNTAPAIFLCFNTVQSASSSMMPPRAALTRKPIFHQRQFFRADHARGFAD